MKRAEKAVRIAEPNFRIPLRRNPPVPLDHGNPFELLVAVLMSAQTTDVQVNEVTPALFTEGQFSSSHGGVGGGGHPWQTYCQVGLAPTEARTSNACPNCWSSVMIGEVRFLVRGTRRPPWSGPQNCRCCHGPSVWRSCASPLTPTFTGLHCSMGIVGDTERRLNAPRKT